jgi:hypothetical protein
MRAIKARPAVFSVTLYEMLPEAGPRRRVDQTGHGNTRGTGAATPAADIDREFRNAGIAGAATGGRGGGKGDHHAINLDGHNWVMPV